MVLEVRDEIRPWALGAGRKLQLLIVCLATMVVGMAFWNRKRPATDLITHEDLAAVGRLRILGADLSGIDDEMPLVSALIYQSVPADGPGCVQVVEELRRHAEKGEWEKVGAWRFARFYLPDEAGAADLIDEGLLALRRMRITNLAMHLAPIDIDRYIELTGEPPANDGFIGAPTFESHFGPTRQYYFDQAITSAAARTINRLPSAEGVPPGPLESAIRSMWDFGLLIYRGPLLVDPDIASEPSVVRPAVVAASGVDHQLFADRLVDGALRPNATHYWPWTSLGAARFIEDYLAPSVADSQSCLRAIDDGLVQLIRRGDLGLNMSPELLTRRQQERLSTIGY